MSNINRLALYHMLVIMLIFPSLAEGSKPNKTLSTAVREFCWESFNATCPPDHVILMTRARYGRMSLNRCLTRDYYIGCSSDVIEHADKRCSGRRSCTIDVPDNDFHRLQPCPKDLMAYLEASYQCVPVASGNVPCSSQRTITLKNLNGYLASSITASTGIGSTSCPWTIRVPPGQTINLTLFDFNLASIASKVTGTPSANGVKKPAKPVRTDASCQMYAIIKEKGRRDKNICNSESRQRMIYSSKGSTVQIHVMAHGVQPDSGLFIIRYEAVGCPDLPTPAHGIIHRRGDKLTISCNSTGDVRHLVCSDTKWIGEIKNCSQSGATNLPQSADTDKAFPYGLVVAIVIGVVLGIALGVILLTIVMICQRRFHQKKRSKNGIFFSGSSQSSVGRMDCGGKHSSRPLCGESVPGSVSTQSAGVIRTGQYGYAHVWELQQLKGSTSSPDVIDMDHRDSTSGTGILCGDPLVIYERTPGINSSNGNTRIMHGPRTKDCPTYESSVPMQSLEDAPFYSDYDPDQAVLHVVCPHHQQAQQCQDCQIADRNGSATPLNNCQT